MLDVTDIKEKVLRTSLEFFEKLKTSVVEIYQEGKAAAQSKKDESEKHTQDPESNFSIEREEKPLKKLH